MALSVNSSKKNGGRDGIQHVALRVDNIENAIADLMAKGVRMIDEKPRYGAGGSSIAFVHPKATGGVFNFELCQRNEIKYYSPPPPPP